MRFWAGLAAGALLAATPTAASEVKSALTADEISEALTAAGLSASPLSDLKTGAPVFKADAGDGEFWVRTLDCSGTKTVSCSTLVFFRNFTLSTGSATPRHIFLINQYNEQNLSGRAYLLPGAAPGGGDQVGIDYVVDLKGGVSTDHLAGRIAQWSQIVRAFIGQMTGK